MWESFKPRTNEAKRNAHKILARKPEEKKSSRKYISRVEDNVRMGFKEIWREYGPWIQLVQNRPSCKLLRKR